jgi:hypothetical protein
MLRPGGRVLFTDPITIAGMLRREEMIIRSAGMGEFVLTPAGVDQALLRQVGSCRAWACLICCQPSAVRA